MDNGKKIQNSKLKIQNLNEVGQLFVLTLIAVSIVMVTTVVIIGSAQLYFQNTGYNSQAEKAISIAEAGIDKAIASLNASGGNYNGEIETLFGDGSYSTTVTNKDANTKIITSTGYIPNKANPKVRRTISIEAAKGIGVNFNYGMQIGEGGLDMDVGNTVKGSIYSNGNIIGLNNTTVEGDLWVAGGTQPTPNQEADCSVGAGGICQDYYFGKNVGGDNRQDIAQSFTPNASGVLNKVLLKLARFGSPANPTVRIMKDVDGPEEAPDKNQILATATLSASALTEQAAFIDVTFDTAPTLASGTKYWIMIHTQNLNDNRYFNWSIDSTPRYNDGSPKWSSNWQAGNPTWSNISGDLDFKIYMGGAITSVDLGNGSVVNGDVHANSIQGTFSIGKDAYYQTIGPNITVSGASCTGNSHCHPGSTDPPPVAFPISDANITQWQQQAQSEGVTVGDITGCPTTIGPGKIQGNINISTPNCTVTIKQPIWVNGDGITTGNFTTANNVTFNLDPGYGNSSGVMVVDGRVNLDNSNEFNGSGTDGSYLMLVTKYDSRSNSIDAVTLENSTPIKGIFYAPKGIITSNNGSTFNEVIAWKLVVRNSINIEYDGGLTNVFFSSGPQGKYSIIKGTYQLK